MPMPHAPTLAAALLAAAAAAGAHASSSTIIVATPSASVFAPGQTGSVVFHLSDLATPLFGYSLDVLFAAQPGATGSLHADVAMTNFSDANNLITAAGATRDPFFSVILPTANGVFLSTNTDDLSAVSLTPGVNHVLAEVVFTVSNDALGSFSIDLGLGTALANSLGFAAPFEFAPITIDVVAQVVPLPPAASLGALGLALLAGTGRRRPASVSH